MKGQSAVFAAAVGHDEPASAGRKCGLIHFDLLDFDNIIMTEKQRKVKPERRRRCNIMRQAEKIQHRQKFLAEISPGKQGML